MAPNGTKTRTQFSVTRKNIILVKPTHPTPSETLSLSTIDNNPNIEMLCQSVFVYRANDDNGIMSSSDPALAIKRGLARALVYYYPLAGKLKRSHPNGTLKITCNGDGVPFASASVDCSLESLNYLDGIDPQILQPLLLDYDSDSEYGYYPLVLQVTRFSCGGFTVGMRLSHSVCDGFGESQFFMTVGDLAAGKSEPTVKPVWERQRLVGILGQDEPFHFSDMGSFTKSPFLPVSEPCHEIFSVDAESIRRLKMLSAQKTARDETPNTPFTTVEVLGAYIWRSRFRALRQNPNGKTTLHLTLGIRHLLNPPLPEGYYGNAFVSASVVLSGKDLDGLPLPKVAKLIKESKRVASESGHIAKMLDFLEALRQRDVKIDDCGASLVVTDWRQLKLSEEVDFGWRGAVNSIPVPWSMPEFVSLCVFLPANRVKPGGEGGMRVLVSFPAAAMDVFKQEMDALKNGSPGFTTTF